VTLIGSRWRKFTELVTDHIFGNKNGHVLPSIVHRKGVSNEIGNDCRSSTPCLDESLFVLFVEQDHLV